MFPCPQLESPLLPSFYSHFLLFSSTFLYSGIFSSPIGSHSTCLPPLYLSLSLSATNYFRSQHWFLSFSLGPPSLFLTLKFFPVSKMDLLFSSFHSPANSPSSIKFPNLKHVFFHRYPPLPSPTTSTTFSLSWGRPFPHLSFIRNYHSLTIGWDHLATVSTASPASMDLIDGGVQKQKQCVQKRSTNNSYHFRPPIRCREAGTTHLVANPNMFWKW